MVDVKHQRALWSTFIDVLHTQKYWMGRISDELGITPQMAQAMNLLPPSGTLTMKELACEMWCDASNVTGVIDRLEARGLVERRPSDQDRRMKCVALTTAGKRLRRKIDERFNESPPAIAALCEGDKQVLHDILTRALENASKQRDERSG